MSSNLLAIPSPTTDRRPGTSLGFLCRAYRTTWVVATLFRAERQLGFAIGKQAHHNGLPNRVHFRYGLVVHLRLLSTPPRGDAVTLSYESPEQLGKDFHLADSVHLPAHSPFAPRKDVLILKYAKPFAERKATMGCPYRSCPIQKEASFRGSCFGVEKAASRRNCRRWR